VAVVLRVENIGREAGTFETRLLIDGEAVDSRPVRIGARETALIVFERQFEEPGRYRIGTDSQPLDTVVVRESVGTATPPGDGQSPAIRIVDANLPYDWVGEGLETNLRVTVENTENETANRTLTVTVDGEPVTSETVTLGPGERRTVDIGFGAASGTVAVEGVEAGRIDIRNTRTASATDPDVGGGGGPQFVVFAVLVTALGITVAGAVAMARWYD
jgi:archaellum component FlaG (FlaF/FlaG flagellin family)